MVFLLSFLVLSAFFSVGSTFREAKDEEFPFQVAIQTLEKRHLCGGAIITPKWILTASSCLNYQASVRVCYGSVDSNKPLSCINSRKIHHQNDFNLFKKKRLALIELEMPVEFSKTVKQAKLPKPTAQLRNTTKLCGWKTTQDINLPPNLYVSDSYYVIPENCRNFGGAPVALDIDEFCGMDEESQNLLFNLGTIVSKSAIVLGILTEIPIAASQPYIYVKMSEHDQWIKDVLQSDAQHINWANEVPKDSAPVHSTVSLAVLIISVLLIRFL